MSETIAPSSELDVEAAGGVRIHCRCYDGPGQAVVMLHGNGEDYRCFRKQMKDFLEFYRVILIDSRGHGASGMGEPFSIRTMADDVAAVLDALELKRVMMVGFSDGGNIALYFALKYPSRLEKLVVAGANLFPEGLAAKVRRGDKRAWKWLTLLGRVNARAARKARIIGLMVTEPRIDPWELESVEAPTLVLAGQRDMILEEHSRLIAESIPDAHLRMIPATDHFIFENNPGWTNETILRFLRG